MIFFFFALPCELQAILDTPLISFHLLVQNVFDPMMFHTALVLGMGKAFPLMDLIPSQ